MILVVLLAILVSVFLIKLCKRPNNYPPGPSFLPIIGNLFHYKTQYKKLKYHHLVWCSFAKKYGDIVGLKLGRNLVVSVTKLDIIRDVLCRPEFSGRPNSFFQKVKTFGKNLGIVFVEGSMWKNQRKFSLHSLRQFGLGRKVMEDQIREECMLLIENFRSQCKEPILMDDAFGIPILNVLWTMIAGKRFDIEDKTIHKLLDLIHSSFRLMDMSGGTLNQLPFLKYIIPELGGYNKIMNALLTMMTFLKEIIENHKRSLKDEPRDLIDSFLQYMALKTDDTFTDEQLLSLCLDLFMAGSETTSNSLSFAMLYMILYPEVQQKIQKEMDDVLGRNKCPTLEDRQSLRYAQAVILEIQRMANIAPLGIAHKTTEATQLCGYDIPKDTIILTNLYNVHMDPQYWDEPNKFKPERFLNKYGNVVVDEEHFIPFGLGKRRCIGEVLAKANLFIFFTSILYHFSLEVVDGSYPDTEPYDGITLSPKPYLVKFIPRAV